MPTTTTPARVVRLLAITTIAVDPAHHRSKVGTRLLYELVSQGIAMGAKAVSLEVRVSNWGAIRLYSRFGFRPVGTRKGYYQETNEDALVMWAHDVDSEAYGERLAAITADLRSPTVIEP